MFLKIKYCAIRGKADTKGENTQYIYWKEKLNNLVITKNQCC